VKIIVNLLIYLGIEKEAEKNRKKMRNKKLRLNKSSGKKK